MLQNVILFGIVYLPVMKNQIKILTAPKAVTAICEGHCCNYNLLRSLRSALTSLFGPCFQCSNKINCHQTKVHALATSAKQ